MDNSLFIDMCKLLWHVFPVLTETNKGSESFPELTADHPAATGSIPAHADCLFSLQLVC